MFKALKNLLGISAEEKKSETSVDTLFTSAFGSEKVKSTCRGFPDRSGPTEEWLDAEAMMNEEIEAEDLPYYELDGSVSDTARATTPPEGFEFITLKRGFPTSIWRSVVDNGCSICGGYARWCAGLSSAPLGDMDIFCKDWASFTSMQADLLKRGSVVLKESDFAVTFRVVKDVKCQVQLIKPEINGGISLKGSAVEIMSDFDLTVCMASIHDEKTLLVGEDFVEDEKNKRIRFNKVVGLVNSITRVSAYSKKGYGIRIPDMEPLIEKMSKTTANKYGDILDYIGTFEECRGEDGEYSIDKSM